MRYRRSRASEEAGVDMTPMLDLVFIMLIFFIVSAVFLDETALAMEEPPDAPAAPESPMKTILVQLDASNQAFINGDAAVLTSVPNRIEALRAQAPAAHVLLNVNAKTNVDTVVFLKDRFDAASVPLTLKVDP